MSTPITNHVQRALDRLFQQYKGLPKIEALYTSFMNQIQELEDVFQQLITDRALESAEGSQLDLLGAIVGQPRDIGQSDDSYRLRIKVRIIQNLSEGEAERAIQVYQALLQATFVIYSELYPASIYIMAGGSIPAGLENYVRENLRRVLPATVEVAYMGYFDPTNPFRMAPFVGAGGGFGDLNDASVGGKFGAIYP